MSENIIPIPADYDEVKSEIWESDLILVRNRRGNYFRAAKACLWDDKIFCIEIKKYRGVTAIPLEQLVLRYPGRVDVYEVNPQNRWETYDRQAAIAALKNILFSRRDLKTVLLETFWKLFNATEETNNTVPYGSEAIRLAERTGGMVDPRPDQTDERVKPNDLAVSPLYRYRFTFK